MTPQETKAYYLLQRIGATCSECKTVGFGDPRHDELLSELDRLWTEYRAIVDNAKSTA